MKKRLIIIALFVITVLTSCKKDAKEKVVTNNKSFDVELLFEVDGCKVYRFEDQGRPRYFTTCQGSISWSESNGKNYTNEIDVQTKINK